MPWVLEPLVPGMVILRIPHRIIPVTPSAPLAYKLAAVDTLLKWFPTTKKESALKDVKFEPSGFKPKKAFEALARQAVCNAGAEHRERRQWESAQAVGPGATRPRAAVPTTVVETGTYSLLTRPPWTAGPTPPHQAWAYEVNRGQDARPEPVAPFQGHHRRLQPHPRQGTLRHKTTKPHAG